MQQLLQITFKNFPPSKVVEQRVRREAQKLEQFCSRITQCHVLLEIQHHHHHQGNHYGVHLDIHAPDREFAVTAAHHNDPTHEDIYVAIRDAFDAGRRQLQDYTRIQQRAVRMPRS
jgi:ribosome-associated translation inhibitor RaiA